MNPNILEELSWRGLLQEVTDREGVLNLGKDDTFYIGYDPTAISLQLGNLVGVIVSIHLAKAGLSALQLFGGATGSVGDPSFRSNERQLMPREQIDANVFNHQRLIRSFFERSGVEVNFVNNYEWTAPVSILEFLRETGKYFTVNYMIAKEHVKTRLEGDGLSFTEFSYILLQAFDFLHLYQNNKCRLQIGGTDQWGNITAGLELIRKKIGGQAYALSFPLVTDSQGKKLGKTADGAIWLDANSTSPYQFHQYFLNTDDKDVVNLLKIFTFLERSEIEEIAKSVISAPERREAQKRLADEVCTLVHGKEATEAAKKSAQVLFGGSLEGLKQEDLESIFADVPSASISSAEYKEMGILDLITASKLVSSKSEGRRMIDSGAIYINNIRATSDHEKPSGASAPIGNLLVLRSGKKNYRLAKIEN